ncbi:MAG TPA: AarF/UbiB family protein [Blastocatellia bacterium]
MDRHEGLRREGSWCAVALIAGAHNHDNNDSGLTSFRIVMQRESDIEQPTKPESGAELRLLSPATGLEGELVLSERHKTKALRYKTSGSLRPRDEFDGVCQAEMRRTSVRVSRFRVVWRVLRLSAVATWFGAVMLWRRLTVRSRRRRQKLNATSFREALVRLGGVFIKVGQQLSQRADILPPPYCDALKELLDEVDIKIKKRDVVAAIKRQTGGHPSEVFSKFRYDPIGSASVSCVYRAALLSGSEVAVKIRRPGIQKEFSADLTALDWIMGTIEFMTIWRPGMSVNFRTEFRDQLLEELDFRMEARYQELFRRYMKRRKALKVTAPKVYYGLSGEDVLVTEFVTGFWVKEMIEKLHKGDEEYLARLDAFGIDPKIVAKHLVRSAHYSFYECPLFHGDPHSANILVQTNNKIVMIDFGACGVFSQRDRGLMWHLNYYYSKEDVGGMVNMVISIMEPLPHVDIQPFRRDLLEAWWKGFYGIKSKHAEWCERTSFRLWLAFYELMRVHKIPVPPKMLRMIRATLLYDTVAAQLYNNINVFKEFEKYSEDAARRARCQIEESVIRQVLLGPDDSTFIKLRQVADVGNELLFRVQKFLSDPAFSFSAITAKIYVVIRTFVRMALIGGGATFAAILFIRLRIHSTRASIESVTQPVSKWSGEGTFAQTLVIAWLISLAVIVFLYGRRIYIEFGDVDD